MSVGVAMGMTGRDPPVDGRRGDEKRCMEDEEDEDEEEEGVEGRRTRTTPAPAAKITCVGRYVKVGSHTQAYTYTHARTQTQTHTHTHTPTYTNTHTPHSHSTLARSVYGSDDKL